MRETAVVATGFGTVSSLGIGIEEFTRSLRNGRNGIRPITVFDTRGFLSNKGGEVQGFDPREWIRKLNPASLGRASQFSVAASHLALMDAGMEPASMAGKRSAVVVGTTDGESRSIERLTEHWLGSSALSSAEEGLLRQIPADNIATSISAELGLRGESVTISTACAAGNYAIGAAFDMIRQKECDFVLCGGSDAMCRKTFAGFMRLGTIAPEVCQPFDRNRRGIMIGEGAGILVLESLEHARRRGARIYAEVLGYGLNCDANHMVAPDRDSIAACMRLTHRHAGILAADVDYICAHGTGTRANDLTEAAAICEVFSGKPPPTSSIKSMLGHTMGAASALAAIACAVAIREEFIPPTINHQTYDPECGLDCVPNLARPARLNVVQNDAFAFGGNNAIVLFGRYKH